MSNNGMLSLLLADAELELVPKEIQSHPSAVRYAGKRGKKVSQTLLDATVHHSALKKIADGQRRGRPDIVHIFLLLCLDSILNIEGRLQIAVHTRNNEYIEVNPATRLQKNYNRFVGLMEGLFESRVVPSANNPLITLQPHQSLDMIVNKIGADEVIVFSETGEKVVLNEFFRNYRDRKKILCIIGGFPEGTYLSPVNKLATKTISIHNRPLKVWTVTSEVLVNYRNSISQ